MSDSSDELTRLLNEWVRGEPAAFDRAAPMLYGELHRIAAGIFARERGQHTLQATALVHEACERLIGANLELADREHFYALAARMMRRLLINHAKARKAAKRGGDAVHVTLDEGRIEAPESLEVLALDAALNQLAEHDARKAEIIEMSYFGGLTQPAIGRVLGLSESTVRREHRIAILWLKKFMNTADWDADDRA